MSDLPKLDVVIANNFGHLPMFIGAEKGYFKQHGVDASFKVVDTCLLYTSDAADE